MGGEGRQEKRHQDREFLGCAQGIRNRAKDQVGAGRPCKFSIGSPETRRSRFLFPVARQRELISVRILEHSDRSPWFGCGLFGERHAFLFESGGGGKYVIRPERNRLKLSDAPLVALWREQGDSGFRARDHQFDPPLFFGERLIGDDLQSKRFGVKLQRHILIGDRNSDELDAAYHASFLPVWRG